MHPIYTNIIPRNRSGKRWASTLVGKMLRVSHKLWLERNNLLHLTDLNGVHGITLIELRKLVLEQYDLGLDELNEEDKYLLSMDKDKLLTSPEDRIRGWLCDVYIARGENDAARLEGELDRRIQGSVIPQLSAAQQEEYLDWRRVRLEG